ncbi:S-methyl-5'-thioinosine phosphorylase [Propionivibrio soli]|uniref:S-methyl-5'-thioinosine phosphorylase n=1 Tax=Propionivibrio soli TaxID=2976531 RepID=UPI0021E9A38A|nr:S-methyl-5'-thioinosine phosphorylase [Propionivibrio soli]
MLAVIGGTGLSQLGNLDVSHREVLRTPYGEPSGAVTFGQIAGQPVAFLARHGYGHTIPPHQVNYRANIWALHHRGALGIISVASVGSIRADLKPGDIVVPNQIIDYTWGRKGSYFEGQGAKVTHIDFTEPYDRALRAMLVASAGEIGLPICDGAVYGATQGPRLETAAEINRYERDGVDIVGMTGMPEAALARELGVPYAAISVVANFAAGRGDSRDGISFEAIEGVLVESMGHVRAIIERLVTRGNPARS